MAATNNPVAYTYGSAATGATAQSVPHPPPISHTEIHIAGIMVSVFGLAELPPSARDVTCLWLLHPRLQTKACMAPFAAQLITAYYAHAAGSSSSSSSSSAPPPPRGMIAVAFDQRNHGTREVNALANEAWRSGNPRHAPDMFSCFAGTAEDVSLLLDFLPGYVFADAAGEARTIRDNVVLGVSLGGHACWHVLMQDARFGAAIVVIGSPDYVGVMSDRARLSKRPAWTRDQGRTFLGSVDFPEALVRQVARRDPTGLLWRSCGVDVRPDREQSAAEVERLLPTMRRALGGKRVLNLSGGADKLVPYRFSKPFIDWLMRVSGAGGWFEGEVFVRDVVYDGVGHEVPGTMVDAMVKFMNETMDVMTEGRERRGSKI